MNPLLLDILPWVHQGACCSQLLLLLLGQHLGKQFPDDLVNAAGGLCYGIGHSNGVCGLLTGGSLCLALLAKNDIPTRDSLVHDYAVWFEQYVAPKSVRCEDICASVPGQASLSACGDLLAACWESLCVHANSYDLLSPNTP
ncbi:MAG: C_GCAxxG_C_C family protein [Desulfovibrio sp.]|nr:C_GCAxxG_C_C family protein [Desulfovibrio sp.]